MGSKSNEHRSKVGDGRTEVSRLVDTLTDEPSHHICDDAFQIRNIREYNQIKRQIYVKSGKTEGNWHGRKKEKTGRKKIPTERCGKRNAKNSFQQALNPHVALEIGNKFLSSFLLSSWFSNTR